MSRAAIALGALLTATLPAAAEVFLGETATHVVKIEVEGDQVVERWEIPRDKRSRPPDTGLGFVNSLGVAMTWVPPGAFRLGKGGVGPSLPVRFEVGFWIGAYEVTQEQYEAIAGKSPSRFTGDRRPVDRVTWQEAQGFCEALNAFDRNIGRLPPGWRYRLPTEAEWEYAARAGSEGARFVVGRPGPEPCVDRGADGVAWFCGNSRTDDPADHDASRWSLKGQEGFFGTHEIGRKHPNAWGLFDVYGNVEEWCLDTWFADHGGAHEDGRVRGSIEIPGERVVRGGSWLSAGYRLDSVSRRGLAQDLRRPDVGFRVVLAPVAPGEVSGSPPPR